MENTKQQIEMSGKDIKKTLNNYIVQKIIKSDDKTKEMFLDYLKELEAEKRAKKVLPILQTMENLSLEDISYILAQLVNDYETNKQKPNN